MGTRLSAAPGALDEVAPGCCRVVRPHPAYARPAGRTGWAAERRVRSLSTVMSTVITTSRAISGP